MSRTMKSALMAWVMAATMTASVACADGIGPLEKSDYGPYSKPVTLCVNSRGEWYEAMRNLAADGALGIVPGPDAPEGVDWSKECVIVVASGDNGYQPDMVL